MFHLILNHFNLNIFQTSCRQLPLIFHRCAEPRSHQLSTIEDERYTSARYKIEHHLFEISQQTMLLKLVHFHILPTRFAIILTRENYTLYLVSQQAASVRFDVQQNESFITPSLSNAERSALKVRGAIVSLIQFPTT